MEFIVEQLPEQSVIYKRRIGAYGSENYELMSALKEWATHKGLFVNSVIYGIAQDNPANTPSEKCRYDVCLVATHDYPIDESVECGIILGGIYAVFTILHTANAVQEFWSYLYQKLHERGLQIDTERPILERYSYKMVEDGKCEFCVPIQ